MIDALMIAIVRHGKPCAVRHLSEPGFAIHERELSALGGIARHFLQHEPSWELLRQHRNEKLLLEVKNEWLSEKHYRTRDELRADCSTNIKRFYNARRRAFNNRLVQSNTL